MATKKNDSAKYEGVEPEPAENAADPIAALKALEDQQNAVKEQLKAEEAALEARLVVVRAALGKSATAPTPRTADVQPKVLEYMQTRPGRQLDAAHVAAAVGVPIESVRSAFQRLAKAGKLIKGAVRGAYVFPDVPTPAGPSNAPEE